LARRKDQLQDRTVRLLARDDARIRLALQRKAPLSVIMGAGQPTEVDELLDTDFCGPGGSDASRRHTQDGQPTALFATVVSSWPDRPPEDQRDELTRVAWSARQTRDKEAARSPRSIL
jgi:hypothetical protein